MQLIENYMKRTMIVIKKFTVELHGKSDPVFVFLYVYFFDLGNNSG
jgi:hypothetical protein